MSLIELLSIVFYFVLGDWVLSFKNLSVVIFRIVIESVMVIFVMIMGRILGKMEC